MAYVAPSTVTTLQTYTSSAHNIIVNDIIDHESRIGTVETSIKRLTYQTRTTNYAINQSSLASAANVFSSNLSFTANGTSTYWVEGQVHGYTGTDVAGGIDLYLVDGSGASLNRVWFSAYNQLNLSRVHQNARFSIPYTPSAGTITLNLRCIYLGTAANGAALECSTTGAGGSYYPPIWMAVYGPNTT